VITDAEDKALLTFDTPAGEQVLDIAVYNEDGDLLGYIETKSGGASYGGKQLLKDEWLRSKGYLIDVVFQG